MAKSKQNSKAKRGRPARIIVPHSAQDGLAVTRKRGRPRKVVAVTVVTETVSPPHNKRRQREISSPVLMVEKDPAVPRESPVLDKRASNVIREAIAARSIDSINEAETESMGTFVSR